MTANDIGKLYRSLGVKCFAPEDEIETAWGFAQNVHQSYLDSLHECLQRPIKISVDGWAKSYTSIARMKNQYENRFNAAKASYEVLHDPELRRQYDTEVRAKIAQEEANFKFWRAFTFISIIIFIGLAILAGINDPYRRR